MQQLKSRLQRNGYSVGQVVEDMHPDVGLDLG